MKKLKIIKTNVVKAVFILIGLHVPTTNEVHAGAANARQTRFGKWWDDRTPLLRILVIVALAAQVLYIAWRITSSLKNSFLPISLALLLSELFGFWSLLAQFFFSWSRPDPNPPKATTNHSIDVFVCTYNESIAVLRPTLLGCLNMDTPHTTYVLDDGRRPEVEKLAKSLGAQYITREDNKHAKAGNVNAALKKTNGDLVFILDADHVPFPDALSKLVGYFEDESCAIVQSPHDFYNQDSFQHYAPGRHEQSVFYQMVLPGKDRHGASFWCGSAAMIRRKSLEEVGGVATETIAEDFHTTLKMLGLGYKSRYHNEILVQGQAPLDISGYLLQRDRWARGNLEVFKTKENPLISKKLSLKQRLSFTISLVSYMNGPIRMLSLLTLSAILLTGILPFAISVKLLLGLWLPAAALSIVAGEAMSRGFSKSTDSLHYDHLTGEIYAKAWLGLFTKKTTTFKVTPKEGTSSGGFSALADLHLLIVITFALASALLLRLLDAVFSINILPPMHGLANYVVPIFAILELRRVLKSIAFVTKHRQKRKEFRFPVDYKATIVDIDSKDKADVALTNISPSGAQIRCDAQYEKNKLLLLSIDFLGGSSAVPIEILAKVVMTRKNTEKDNSFITSLQLVALGDAELNVLNYLCYVHSSFEKIRGYAPKCNDLTINTFMARADLTEEDPVVSGVENTDHRRSLNTNASPETRFRTSTRRGIDWMQFTG